jgi:beta-lactamase regulating signal transducer with metallopeptidase domain
MTHMTVTHALGWALLASLWQDAAAAAALAALLAVVPVRAARVRYALATVTLVVALALPLATALRVFGGSPWVEEPRPLIARAHAAVEPALSWIVTAWFAGVALMSLRLATTWAATRRLHTIGTSPVPAPFRIALARLAAGLRVSRPVRLAQSALVEVPAVIGWLRPVILLPASALTGLTPLQLDALLAHELAHVRRYDYLVNVLQSVIETLLFYHPAVWWVSRCVRDEREHCCDDLAVTVCGDAHAYATALVDMERLRVATPAWAMAASGGSLVTRVRRLVAPGRMEIFPRGLAGVLGVALACAAGAGLATAPLSPPPSAGTLLAHIEALPDPDERHSVVKALGRIGDPRTLPALVTIARHDPDDRVQQEAVEAIGHLRGTRAQQLLARLARTHPDPGVRREAVKQYTKDTKATDPQAAVAFLTERLRYDRSADVQADARHRLAKLLRE